MLSEPKSKPRPRPLGNARGPLVHNSKHTRRNGSNDVRSKTRSRVNGVSSNSLVKIKESLRERRNRERRSKGTSLNSNEVRLQVKRQMSLPTREELYRLYRGYSRKNKPKLKVTLKERRIQERKLRGTSLNGANLQVNARAGLPSREALYNLYRGYSRKNKMNNVRRFVSTDLYEEMDDIFFNYEPVEGDPEFSDEKRRVTLKRLRYGASWFLDQEVENIIKKRFSDDKEVDNILKNLKAVEDKYLNKFPEEKLKIKMNIRLKYGQYYLIIKNNTIDMFRPIKEIILLATKEIRNAIYEREPVSVKNEIIDKYIKDIRSIVSFMDEHNIHLPLVRVSLELFYNSLQFGTRSNRTVKDVRPNYRLMNAHAKNQLRYANRIKDVKGKMELTKDMKVLIDGQDLSTKERKELAEQAAAALMSGPGLSAKNRNALETLVAGQDLSAKNRNALRSRLASTSI